MTLIAFRTRRTFRCVRLGPRRLTPGASRRMRVVNDSGAGRCVSVPGALYVATYGGWHGPGARVTVNGRPFGRRVIPAR